MARAARNGLKSKCCNLILNLYKDIKSKVMTQECSTELFECYIGLRQGKNLSPTLFSIFLNDLEHFLHSKKC